MEIFIVEFRELNGDKDEFVVHLSSSEEKAVEWIQENGEDLEIEHIDYFYAVYKMEVDKSGDSFDSEEFYLEYFDKHGNILEDISVL